MTNQTQSKKKEINALLRLENKNIILAMTNEEAGALMKAIYIYGTEGVIPETLDRSLRLIFLVFKEDIDKDRKAYSEMCKRNAQNASKSHSDKSRTTVSDRTPPPPYNNNDNNNNGGVNSFPLMNVSNENEDPRYSFESIWNMYGKPVGSKKDAEALWAALTTEEKDVAIEYVRQYIRIRPNIQFRRNFDRFLSLRTWENEPIATLKQYSNDTKPFTSSKTDSRRNDVYSSATAAMQQISLSQ